MRFWLITSEVDSFSTGNFVTFSDEYFSASGRLSCLLLDYQPKALFQSVFTRHSLKSMSHDTPYYLQFQTLISAT